jgi:hypothetical protein
LKQTHTFEWFKSDIDPRKTWQETSPASVGATNILLDLYDLPNRDPAFQLLAKAFTIESLEHVFQKPCRLNYIDTTKEEKQILQILCLLQIDAADPFLNRILSVYYGLKLYARHFLHEDALLLYAPLLMICGDIAERRFEPYFDREDLKTMSFQLLRDTLDLEKQVPKQVRDLFAFTSLSVLFHYFEEPDPQVPKSALELAAYLGSKMKDLAANRFIEDHAP